MNREENDPGPTTGSTGDFLQKLAARFPAVEPAKLRALGISSAVELLGYAMAKGAAVRLALHLGVTEAELGAVLDFTATLAPAGAVERLKAVEVRTYAMGAIRPRGSAGDPLRPVPEKKESES